MNCYPQNEAHSWTWLTTQTLAAGQSPHRSRVIRRNRTPQQWLCITFTGHQVIVQQHTRRRKCANHSSRKPRARNTHINILGGFLPKSSPCVHVCQITAGCASFKLMEAKNIFTYYSWCSHNRSMIIIRYFSAALNWNILTVFNTETHVSLRKHKLSSDFKFGLVCVSKR